MKQPWLYRGTVWHSRQGAVQNSFSYPCLFLCFPIAQRQQLASRLFGLNHFSLFGFYESDHLQGGNLEVEIRHILEQNNLHEAGHSIWLMTMPRILGFVFNPVSFWYCHDHRGALRAVLCEVNNTFGERHGYLLTAPNRASINKNTELHCEKIFHVSPFYAVEGSYRFHFDLSPTRRQVGIDYFQQGNTLSLQTLLQGQATILSDRNLLRGFLALGWSTVMVVARIHWQALRLWLKGVRFHRKPSPPHQEIST